MSISAERRVDALLKQALDSRASMKSWQDVTRRHTVEFIDAALQTNWNWKAIGEALEITDRAAKAFYDRNR